MKHALVLLAFLATPLSAQTPMTAEEFDRYTQGKTLTFGTLGDEAYGVEQYLSNKRVIWSFLDGNCQYGEWYQDGANICFTYDFDPTPQCWQFFAEGSGLRAIFMNTPNTSVLYEALDDAEPLICDGVGA